MKTNFTLVNNLGVDFSTNGTCELFTCLRKISAFMVLYEYLFRVINGLLKLGFRPETIERLLPVATSISRSNTWQIFIRIIFIYNHPRYSIIDLDHLTGKSCTKLVY